MRLAFLLVLCLVTATVVHGAEYGQKTVYKKGVVLPFPDCELTFLGQRKVSSPVFKPGFLCYDFQAAGHGKTKDIFWSSGTGDIGPLFFEVGGKKFVLELKHSDAFPGWMKEDELVLWPQGKFDALKKN